MRVCLLLFVTVYLLFITVFLLFVTVYLLFVTVYLLFITVYLLFVTVFFCFSDLLASGDWLQVTFDASAEETKGAMVNMSECSSSTMVFEHQPGCRVCKGMFEHYTMPDGRTVHLFERPQEV